MFCRKKKKILYVIQCRNIMHNGQSGMNCMVFYALCRHSTAYNGSNVLIPRLAHTYYNEKPK